jgi:MFS family permease
MNTQTVAKVDEQLPASWTPIAVICLAQTLTYLNITGLSASIRPVASDLNVAAAVVQRAVVVYALIPAALLILGGKIGNSFLGLVRGFRGGLAIYATGMLVVATAKSGGALLVGEAITGIGACVMLPTFIGIIAANYRGQQQATAVGFLGSAAGIGSVAGSLGGGAIASTIGWRVLFFFIGGIAVLALALSWLLKTVPKPRDRLALDWIGALLSALGILLVVEGANQVSAWGFLLAKAAAPVSVFGLSPVVFMLAGGTFVFQAFLSSQEARVRKGKEPLLSPQVSDTPTKRSAVTGLLLTQAIFAAVNLALPLYTQIVQGMTPFRSSMVFLPCAFGSIAGALVATRLGVRIAPRNLAFGCFVGSAASLTLLAVAVSNKWSNLLVILGLALTGISYGTVAAVLSSAIISASSAELGNDVGGLRGTATNLGTALSTALAGAILAAVLIGSAGRQIAVNPHVEDELRARLQVDLNKIKFMSNDQLEAILYRRTDLDDRQKAELVAINEASRLDALRIVFLFAVGLALLGIFAIRKLPARVPVDR